MARYGKAFKDRAVARLLPPESAVLDAVALEFGVSVGKKGVREHFRLKRAAT